MASDVLPAVDEAVLSDLRRRLREFRAVPTTGDHGWERGSTRPISLTSSGSGRRITTGGATSSASGRCPGSS